MWYKRNKTLQYMLLWENGLNPIIPFWGGKHTTLEMIIFMFQTARVFWCVH